MQRASAVVAALLLSATPLTTRAAAHENVDVRAYVNDSCIVADEPYFVPAATASDTGDATTKRILPLIGLVVGELSQVLIEHAASAATGHIRAGANAKDTRYAVTKEMNLYRATLDPSPALSLNGALGCMTIVAAKYKPDSTDCRADYRPKEVDRDSMNRPENEWKTVRSDDSVENQLRRANICVDGKARAVYEARFEFSPDGTAYRLRSAGYRVDQLLTTEQKGATRGCFYTLTISQPSTSAQHETLSTAWVHLGSVSAGSRVVTAADDAAPWLHVPSMTNDARRAYEQQTKVQQDVAAEIEALKRALTRNQRMLGLLDGRIADAGSAADANADVTQGLKQERSRIAVQIQTQEVELEARNAEYHDLPRAPLEFMPVTIEVAVTESESEKKALLALADIIDSNKGQLASAGAGLVSRSVDVSAPPAVGPDAELASARAHYFDALLERQTRANPQTTDELELAKARYNDARRTLGLDPIQ